MNYQRSFLMKKIEKVSYFSRSTDDAVCGSPRKKVAYFGHFYSRQRNRVLDFFIRDPAPLRRVFQSYERYLMSLLPPVAAAEFLLCFGSLRPLAPGRRESAGRGCGGRVWCCGRL